MFQNPAKEEKVKIKFSDAKKCILKKEIGEDTEECRKIREKMNIEE